MHLYSIIVSLALAATTTAAPVLEDRQFPPVASPNPNGGNVNLSPTSQPDQIAQQLPPIASAPPNGGFGNLSPTRQPSPVKRQVTVVVPLPGQQMQAAPQPSAPAGGSGPTQVVAVPAPQNQKRQTQFLTVVSPQNPTQQTQAPAQPAPPPAGPTEFVTIVAPQNQKRQLSVVVGPGDIPNAQGPAQGAPPDTRVLVNDARA